MTRWRYLPNVVTLTLDAAKCSGCGMCAEVCPQGVFLVANRKSEIIDRDACMECGACARNCVSQALFVQAGVGCATAVLTGMLRGTEPVCNCSADSGGCA